MGGYEFFHDNCYPTKVTKTCNVYGSKGMHTSQKSFLDESSCLHSLRQENMFGLSSIEINDCVIRDNISLARAQVLYFSH